ncbi:MAG TPA: hypothetical protein VGD99_07430 [Anaerolineae bacterium]|jgi:hypothetical protein
MPTLPEILSQLQIISQETALLGLFLTACIVLIGRDWRVLILALLIQYVLVGVVLSRLTRPDIATLKVMIGAFICPILFLSARQVSGRFRSMTLAINDVDGEAYGTGWRPMVASVTRLLVGQSRRRGPAATGLIFRVFAALLMILVAITLSSTFRLPGLSASVNTAVFWLILAGLATLVLTEDPMKVGLGLFTTLTGFELFYTTVERSLLLTGLWGAVNLLIALVIGYLIVVKGTGSEEEF